MVSRRPALHSPALGGCTSLRHDDCQISSSASEASAKQHASPTRNVGETNSRQFLSPVQRASRFRRNLLVEARVLRAVYSPPPSSVSQVVQLRGLRFSAVLSRFPSPHSLSPTLDLPPCLPKRRVALRAPSSEDPSLRKVLLSNQALSFVHEWVLLIFKRRGSPCLLDSNSLHIQATGPKEPDVRQRVIMATTSRGTP